jgi:hypothetical protein
VKVMRKKKPRKRVVNITHRAPAIIKTTKSALRGREAGVDAPPGQGYRASTAPVNAGRRTAAAIRGGSSEEW